MNWVIFIKEISKRYYDFLESYKKEIDFSEKWNIHLSLIEIEKILKLFRNLLRAYSELKIRGRISQLYYDLSIARISAENINPLLKTELTQKEE